MLVGRLEERHLQPHRAPVDHAGAGVVPRGIGVEQVGAPVADVACTGTALRDFKRMTDGAAFTEDEVAPHDSDSAACEGIKEFVPAG